MKKIMSTLVLFVLVGCQTTQSKKNESHTENLKKEDTEPVLAMPTTIVKFTGKYESKDDYDRPTKYLNLNNNGSLNGSIHHNEYPATSLSGKILKFGGTWSQKNNLIILNLKEGVCECQYGQKLEFYGGTDTGVGLSCIRKSGDLYMEVCTLYKKSK